ncbi:hypothetical protein IY39_03955 [Flavobacterium psychrophilum]|uniref:hypothetical protein n=1 Tax=Flavobacterium psychrophilum TaxID=96345 RepID=UPI000618784B|nr:hypothetical protein [Flavobacterium psychrophilum]AKC26056.1 hypothetical protein IY39_03955 [Flavobacterium psychrophilum]
MLKARIVGNKWANNYDSLFLEQYKDIEINNLPNPDPYQTLLAESKMEGYATLNEYLNDVVAQNIREQLTL